MFGDSNDYRFKMDLDSANHLGIEPEAANNVADNSLYDSRSGFSDIELLSSLSGSNEDVPVAQSQDSVSEFIANTNVSVEFNSQGDPQAQSHASNDSGEIQNPLASGMETISTDNVAWLDQDDY